MTVLSDRVKAAGKSTASTKWGAILLFLAPALALYLLFVFVPLVQGAYYSLFKWKGFGALDLTTFIGIGNFQKALSNPIFQTALKNNMLLLAGSLLIQIPFALALAVYLNQRFRGRTLFRVIFFLPYVLSEITTGIVFYLILQHDGLVNGALGVGTEWLGDLGAVVPFASFTGGWIPDITVVMIALFVVISWKYFGLHMIILLAGLQGIPHEIYEAAVIDGANRWQAFRHVTLPLLGPTLRVSIFLSAIGSFQLFDMVWALTRGGPVNTTNSMATYIYSYGFFTQQMGYGSAVSVILFGCCLFIALLYQRFVLARDVEGAVTVYQG